MVRPGPRHRFRGRGGSMSDDGRLPVETVADEARLRALYPEPTERVRLKELDHLDEHCRRFIALSPFLAFGSTSPGRGTDVSPRGDHPGFVRVLDDKTLAIPDRPGNNRLDGFRNIMRDPRIALLFLIPGVGETFRVNGRASISIDPELMQSFAVNG